ncbi:protein Aster-B [Trichonephila inaurata madagascariensis]|uniref:Protein Aster-B n=1 Tax=Trichonephila inaurata madagascariensis TaxID=2747483 RepID=A0A8X6Y294_9ARAC|nr:protein Aster-B [Trichonephila inaurata madagascariensis]
MSGSRHTTSDNQASASENESDRYSSNKQYASVNHNKTLHANQVSDENISLSNQKKQSTSSLHLNHTDNIVQDISAVDGNVSRNSPGASSDKESGSIKSVDAKSTHSLTPSVVLNSAGSSVSSLQNALNSKESPEKDSDNQYQLLDAGSNMSPGSISQESSLFPDNLSRSSESGKSIDLGLQKTPDTSSSKTDITRSDKLKSSEKKEKKKSSWYNMLNPTYKSRSDDFKRLFKDLPDSERLIVDYSCALQKDILVHGRLYVSQNYICFYANIFRWETFLLIRCRDVTSMTKEKTARVIPNAIQISTESEKHFFTSFGARDKTFLMLFRIWQNVLIEQPMSSQELWQWVHFSYGEELGLTSDDDDYVAPPIADEDMKSIKHSDQHIVKYIKKSYEKGDSINLQESASELAAADENSESANGMDGNSDPPAFKEIEEEISQQNDSKCALNPKFSENPTDMSDTTESADNIEDVEFKCPCSSHEGKEVLNTVFPLPVDQVFSLIFTGSKFYNDLLESRKTYDIMESPWQLCPEFDLKMRQVTYTLTLNHSMAKSAQTTETQRLLKHSKPGQVYTVDCDVVNTGIPYSDAFTVKSVYCLTRVSKKECRLRISGCVRYKKSVWGLVKSLIEKSAMPGLADFATDLANALQKEAEISSQQIISKKPRRRKRMKFDPIKCETLKDTPRILQRQPTVRNIGSSISGMDLASFSSTPDIVIRVILITLVILLFLNMLLFYKLWSLEDQSSKQVPPAALEYPDNPSSFTKEDYLHLLHKQDALHRAETARWRDALSEVIKLIHLIEKSLSELKSSIDTYSSTSVLKAIALRMSQNSEDLPPSVADAEVKEG